MEIRGSVAYVGMCADILHIGHIRILEFAHQVAKTVVVGLLTDEAIKEYKEGPLMSYEERYEIVNALYMVGKVVPQKTLDYTENLLLIKTDIVVHADDWQTGVQADTRDKVKEVITAWNGMLFEPEYTPGISSTMYKEILKV